MIARPPRWSVGIAQNGLVLILAFSGSPCVAAGSLPDPSPVGAPVAEGDETPPALPDEGEGRAWSFSASISGYLVPGDRDYAQPTLAADRDWLHLEGRYNYEDFDTGSAWVGGNFSVGERWTLELTPMVGAVFGATTGIAPGYEASLSWWKLELYSEGEYVFDTGDSSDDFFYTWSELSVAPTDRFRVGMVVQRTRLYQSASDLQRGFLVGCSYRGVDCTAYVFNPGTHQPTLVLAVGVSF